MSSIILGILVMLDLVLLGIVYVLGKRQVQPLEIMQDLTEDRRMLKELRQVVKEELEDGLARMRAMLERVNTLAAEVEIEIKSSRTSMNKEMEEVLGQFSNNVEKIVGQITRKQSSLEKISRMAEQQTLLLSKSLERGEKMTQFFNNRLPYEEVLEEIQDKKYADARELLSKGMMPQEVARYLNMPESEVSLIAAVR